MTVSDTVLAGRYRLVARVGEGGMAVVYRAVDELLGRPVAVKVLREAFRGDAEFVERFRREAQAAASLSHPNVVQVFDVGRDQDRPFMVMELVDGRSLKEILRERGRLEIPAAVAIAVGVARALAHAHRHGLIHRDIKPHNILLTTEGMVKVADFGIARAASATSLTQAGTVLGSVHYFSPEQARGQAIGTASDLYSLGVVLFEMLAGRLPFVADSPIAVALQHLNEAPPRLRALRPEVSAELESLVMHLLAKDPSRRPPSADAVAEQLRRLEPQAEEFPLVRLVQPRASAAPWMGDGAASTPADPDDAATRISVVVGTTASRALGPGPAGSAGREAGPAGSPATSPLPAGPGRRRRVPWRWVVAMGFFAGLVAAAGALSDWLFPREVNVPDVVGRTEAEARSILERSGLAYAVDRRVYSTTVPAGVVVSQDPEPGRQVREGRKVWATVSLGPEVGEVPDVVGQPLREARVQLAQQGFVVGEVQEGLAPGMPAGVVVAQDPPPGSRVEKGRPVRLTVSRGPEAATVVLPDLRGMSVQEATSQLEQLGLQLGLTSARYSSHPPGVIIDQQPPAGSELRPGDRVDLVYSQGPQVQGSLPLPQPSPGPQGQGASPGSSEVTAPGAASGPAVPDRMAAGSATGSGQAAGAPGTSEASPAPSSPGPWRSAELTVQVPQGPDREVVILVIDDYGPSEVLRRTVPGGTVLVQPLRGRGQSPRFQVYIDGRMVQEGTFAGGGAG